MKKIITIILLFTILSCNSNDSKTEATNDTKAIINQAIVFDFLNDISSLENIEGENPIVLFQTYAMEKANKVMPVSNDNIQDVLTTAKEFSKLVITTGDHTIVQINDIDNCKQSGSWGACMPFGKGYIKKGKLNLKEDFINNIIGLPDTQVRTAYFFK